jgi:hypothetical protein
MATLDEKIAAELENIDRVLSALPPEDSLHQLSRLELGGTAAFIHSFYNGVENIVKQVLVAKGTVLPAGATWHRDLLELAVKQGLVARDTHDAMTPFLAFRHYFVHAYSSELRAELLAALVHDARPALALFLRDIHSQVS